MRKTIAAAGALAALAVPSTALAAGHSFSGQCRLSGLDFYGPTMDAPTTQRLTGVGTCTGSLDGGPQASYMTPFSIDHTGAMVKITDAKTSGPVLTRVLLVAATGHGQIRFGTSSASPTIGFTSTQSLVADVLTGDLGGVGVATVSNSGTGEPQLDTTFVGLNG